MDIAQTSDPFLVQLLGLDGYELLPHRCHIRSGRWVIGLTPTAIVSRCSNPQCRSEALIRHTAYERKVAHIPVGIRRTQLLIVVPRWRCKICGKTSAPPLPHISLRHRVTDDLVAFLLDCYQSRLSFVQIAFEAGTSENTAARAIKRSIKAIEAERRKVLPRDIGLDEIRIHRAEDGLWAHLTDLRTGRTIGILPGTSTEHVQHFLGEQDDVSAVEGYSADGAAQFMNVGRENFPHAIGTLDRFHVVKSLLRSLNSVRLAEARRLRGPLANADETDDDTSDLTEDQK